MLSYLSSQILLLCSVTSFASAQQTLYGQCGGIGWTGATSCVSGSHCSVQNAYYSQCLPGGPTTLKTSTTTKPATSTPSKTTSTAPRTSTVAPLPPVFSGITNLISFGDSYSQTGYTTSGGANWIGSLVTTYKPAGRTLLSYSFAYGGATADASLVTPFEPTVESFIDQVTIFKQNLVPSSLWTGANTLFAVWMGVNDVGNAWYLSSWNTLYPQILAQYFAQLQILYTAGGRHFLLLTVPPIQRTPSMLLQSADSQNGEAAAIAQFNTLLASKATAFQSANAGSKVYVYDTQVPFNTALNNPTAYGAQNATCDDASGTVCLWWNDYHPGLAIQGLVATGVAALTGI